MGQTKEDWSSYEADDGITICYYHAELCTTGADDDLTSHPVHVHTPDERREGEVPTFSSRSSSYAWIYKMTSGHREP
jgi:hypothetical protein